MDKANFGSRKTVLTRYAGRLYDWNPNVTLLRINAAENERIGAMLARAANAASGPAAVLPPMRGDAMLDSTGGAFWDLEADRASYETIRKQLKPAVALVEIDCNTDDSEFGDRAADTLLGMMATVRM